MLVFAFLCHMTYIFKKCLSKHFNTNPSNSGHVPNKSFNYVETTDHELSWVFFKQSMYRVMLMQEIWTELVATLKSQ